METYTRITKGSLIQSFALLLTITFAGTGTATAGGLSDLLETLENANKVIKETRELGETLSGKKHGNSHGNRHGNPHGNPHHSYDHHYDSYGFHRRHGYNRFGYNRHGHYNPHYDTRRHH